MNLKTGILMLLVGIAIIGMAASSVSAWGGCYSKDYTYDSAKQKLTTCVSYSKPGWSFETTYYGDAKISVTGSAMATLYELTGVYTVSALGITGASCGTSGCSASAGLTSVTFTYRDLGLPTNNVWNRAISLQATANQYNFGYLSNNAASTFRQKSYTTQRTVSYAKGAWQ